MSNAPQLEIRQRSASLPGESTGIRSLPVVSKFIDTTTCIGCKACEVACQEWNDLQLVSTRQTGTYQTMPTLDANFWNLIKFKEEERDGALAWLMRKDQCMHCADPGCLKACPAPGAIVQYENGIVDVNPDACIGCGLCATGCPFDVPRFHAETGKMAKCTLCVDRVSVGIEPACVKACPTGCLQFGTKEDMLALGKQRVETLKANGSAEAGLYDPPGVGGTTVVTVLAHADHPEWYGLPVDPHVRPRIQLGRGVSARDYILALAQQKEHQQQFAAATAEIDALLTPTTQTAAIPVEQVDQTGTPAHFTRPGNYLGLCGVAAPGQFEQVGTLGPGQVQRRRQPRQRLRRSVDLAPLLHPRQPRCADPRPGRQFLAPQARRAAARRGIGRRHAFTMGAQESAQQGAALCRLFKARHGCNL